MMKTRLSAFTLSANKADLVKGMDTDSVINHFACYRRRSVGGTFCLVLLLGK